ncbi:MAG: MerR family transcriptional regulator [Casimicrobiaceae bacterium]
MNNQGLETAVFEPSYRSGIAARLAGIPVETLRVWERRYSVVGPRVSHRGHRLYTAEDVGRLTLMKQLVALGSPISAVARLSLAELRDMRSAASAAASGMGAGPGKSFRPVRVALVGAAPMEAMARAGALRSSLEIVGSCASTNVAAEALRGVAADVLVLELPALQSNTVATVDALVQMVGARRAIVAYRFGPAAVIAALRDRHHKVMRAPIDGEEFEQLCREARATHAIDPAPSPSPLPLDALTGHRFDDQSLARLAGSLTTLYCECPHHVVELLQSLGAFERYSAQCANRGPDDAELHRYLQRVAGTARVLFEDALVRIARSEGLPLPSDVGNAGPDA